jgi:two-component system chemotaxis response regulator CheY
MDLSDAGEDHFSSVKKITEINPDANVIMLSSIGQEPDLLDAIKTGAKDFVMKPINKLSLFYKIHILLAAIRIL